MTALPGCHTQAQSLDQLMERVQEAIALYLEVEGDSASEPDFVGVQVVAVEAEAISPQRPGAPLAHASAERPPEILLLCGHGPVSALTPQCATASRA